VHGFRCYDNIHVHVCKLIALYTANAYSAEREISASACTRCMTSLRVVAVDRTTRKFYASANAILSHVKYASEMLKLYLVEACCLPVLSRSTFNEPD